MHWPGLELSKHLKRRCINPFPPLDPSFFSFQRSRRSWKCIIIFLMPTKIYQSVNIHWKLLRVLSEGLCVVTRYPGLRGLKLKTCITRFSAKYHSFFFFFRICAEFYIFWKIPIIKVFHHFQRRTRSGPDTIQRPKIFQSWMAFISPFLESESLWRLLLIM